MKLEFHLHDTSNGKRGTKEEEYEDSFPRETIEFLWEEGNLACDCNRGAFLYGESPYDCSSERITLEKVVNLTSGKAVFDGNDWDW